MSVTLAPGILSNIFDGIERPLSEIAKGSGYYISRGISVDSLDTSRKWDTHMVVKKGDRLMPGTIIAEVPETRAITHKVWCPRMWKVMSLRLCRTDSIPLRRRAYRAADGRVGENAYHDPEMAHPYPTAHGQAFSRP